MPKPNPNSLEQFVDRLIAEKGLTSLEPDVLGQIKKDLLDRVEDRINAVIVEKLPPEKLEDFEKMLNQEKSQEEIQSFCQAQIPDLDQYLAAELLSFREKYLTP